MGTNKWEQILINACNLYDLGLKGIVCIVPRSEMSSLVIDESSEATCLQIFGGTVVAEFYDPYDNVDMVSVLFYGPSGCFDVPEAVVDFVDDGDSRKVSDVQLWRQKLVTPSASTHTPNGQGLEYVPGMSDAGALSGDIDKLEALELTPNSKKWFLVPDVAIRELGLDCDFSFKEFSALPSEKRFAPEMWNSPTTQLPGVEWKGKKPGLKDPLSECTYPIHFFMLFWPSDLSEQIVRMTNLYATMPGGEGGTKGSQSWTRLSQSKQLTFFGILMFMALKEVPSIRVHWSKGSDLLRTYSAIVNTMSRIRFESIIRCIHLIDNKDLVSGKDDPGYS
jgi:hypothetical protein